MTLIPNLSVAEEARLTAAARQAGIAPDALLRSFVNRLPLVPDMNTPLQQKVTDAREAAIRAARGRMAHIGASVEDLHQQRQADKVQEADKAQQQDLGD